MIRNNEIKVEGNEREFLKQSIDKNENALAASVTKS